MGSLSAVTYTWTGAGGNYWTTTSSWDTGTRPVATNTTDVIISGTTNVGMYFGTSSYTVRSLTFDDTNDAYTSFMLQRTGNNGSGSSSLTFSSNSGPATLTVAAGSTGDKNFNRGGGVANIVLTSSLDIVHNGSGTLTFGSQINTSGAGGITKSGTGAFILGGSNTYTGNTSINGGTIQIEAGGWLGAGSYSGNISNNGTFIYSGTNNQTLSGMISGNGNIIKNAASTLTLSGNNSYSGTTTINSGTLKAASVGALGQAESIVVNTGGSLLIGVENSIGDSTDITMNGGTIKFEGNINESVGALTLSADSIIDMSGGNISLDFAILYAIMESNLKIYNYSLYSDHLYFNGSTYVNESLPRIQFYSDAGNTLIGDSFIRDFGITNEVCPVPEPGVYVTGLLLMGLMFYHHYRNAQKAQQISTNPQYSSGYVRSEERPTECFACRASGTGARAGGP